MKPAFLNDFRSWLTDSALLSWSTATQYATVMGALLRVVGNPQTCIDALQAVEDGARLTEAIHGLPNASQARAGAALARFRSWLLQGPTPGRGALSELADPVAAVPALPPRVVQAISEVLARTLDGETPFPPQLLAVLRWEHVQFQPFADPWRGTHVSVPDPRGTAPGVVYRFLTPLYAWRILWLASAVGGPNGRRDPDPQTRVVGTVTLAQILAVQAAHKRGLVEALIESQEDRLEAQRRSAAGTGGFPAPLPSMSSRT